eukprot:TRINITY_DN3144_c0_g1_i1.p1 TRINITY_DN3144_c0_g1~~TRINITY_DN3144_c0_g1_i1.p1  ORF type:complete len:152 (-),score=10.46 TRINITY_DN3144_c0_g1_i1:30-485(-)
MLLGGGTLRHQKRIPRQGSVTTGCQLERVQPTFFMISGAFISRRAAKATVSVAESVSQRKIHKWCQYIYCQRLGSAEWRVLQLPGLLLFNPPTTSSKEIVLTNVVPCWHSTISVNAWSDNLKTESCCLHRFESQRMLFSSTDQYFLFLCRL